ncbi:MAG: prolipoprotein diacylglyceryl transferase [Polyangiaceae bacterium]|nr:prolipoprotein diacylglyceryl transferase [Polyangiaceae bacterium]MCW5789260.1 prolipoprotein diacylglyceryl transferase [Polyangiaceae bacterium]
MPSLTWDVDPIAFQFVLPFLLKYVLYGVAAAGLVSAFLAYRAKQSPAFGLVLAAAVIAASFKWGDLQPNVEIRWYSLLFVGVFLGGYALLRWQIVRGGGGEEEAGDFIVYGVLGVLVGARLGHVFFYDLERFLTNPAMVVEIWTGGLASHGAVMGLIFVMWLFTRQRGIPFLEGADRFAFSAALGATLVRVGNLLNSEIVGRVVPDQSWGFRFPRFDVGAEVVPLRYPTQVLEIALGLIILAALYFVDKSAGKEQRPRGLLISVFFAIYFLGRFLIEFWKEYQIAGGDHTGLTMGQILSLIPFALGVYGIYWATSQQLPVGWQRTDLPEEEEELDEEEEAAREEARRRAAKRRAKRKAQREAEKQAAKTSSQADDSASEDDEDDAPAKPEAKQAKTKSESPDEPADPSDEDSDPQREDEDEADDEPSSKPGA